MNLELPCGTYLLARALALPSHTELYGAAKFCVVIKMKQDMAANPELKNVANRTEYTAFNKTVISNADFKAGNTDISVHDMSIDRAGVSDKRVVWLAFFYNVTGLNVERVKFVGSDSVPQSGGVGMLGDSAHIVVKSSSFSALQGGGACFGVWDGTRDVLAQNNDCDGSGTLNFGIQANGRATAAGTFRSAGDIKFINNEVRDVRVVSIDIDGLCSAKRQCGEVVGAQVLGNDIEKSGVWGVRVGHASHVGVANNRIRDIQRDGIAVVDQVDAAMVTLHDVAVERNTIENPGSGEYPRHRQRARRQRRRCALRNQGSRQQGERPRRPGGGTLPQGACVFGRRVDTGNGPHRFARRARRPGGGRAAFGPRRRAGDAGAAADIGRIWRGGRL